MILSKRVFLLIGFYFSIATFCYSQKASISINGLDTSSLNAVEYVFLITIKNKDFPRYWISDTTDINNFLKYPTQSPIYPFLEKKVNKIYIYVDPYKRYGGVLPDSSLLYCTNCITIKKGESINLKLKLLGSYRLGPGEYRIQVATHPPSMSCNKCEQLGEIFSDYYYFKIDSIPKYRSGFSKVKNYYPFGLTMAED